MRIKANIKKIYLEEQELWANQYRKYFKAAAMAMLAGILLGYLYFANRPEEATKNFSLLKKNILGSIPIHASPVVLAMSIFWHNARVSFWAMTSGWIPFLFSSILSPVFNGGVLGLIIAVTQHSRGNVALLLLRDIVPHGIFEIPAILYSTCLGLYFSMMQGRSVLAKHRKKKTTVDAPAGFLENYSEDAPFGFIDISGQILKSFARVVIPLLLIAAFIEVFITPLMHKVM